MKFRLDPTLYAAATPEREREWRMALMDLNGDCDGQPPTLTVFRHEAGVEIAIHPEEVCEPLRLAVRHEALRPHFREYRHVIEQLVRYGDNAYGMRQLETLDYAKKLVHDEAGEMLQRALSGFVQLEHRLARRLFTLIFLVASELPEELVTRHRHR